MSEEGLNKMIRKYYQITVKVDWSYPIINTYDNLDDVLQAWLNCSIVGRKPVISVFVW